MAYSQKFSDHLLRQLNESNRRNLELQSLLAHKDDQLAGANRQLQQALSAATINAQPSLLQNLQKRNQDFQGQLNHAQKAAADARRKLNERTKDFNAVYTQQQQQIHALQQKLNLSGCDDEDIVQRDGTARVISPEKGLAKAQAELLRMRTAYSSLQRQFEAEKKQSERVQSFPATAPGKTRETHHGDDDMDDEEPNTPWIKQEGADVPVPFPTTKPPSPSSKKSMPPPSMPSKLPHSTPQSQPSRKNSAASTVTLASRPKDFTSTKDVGVTAPRSHSKTKKRHRSLIDELDSELDDLDASPPTPRKRPRRSIGSNIDVDTSSIREKFPFKAITDYDEDGGIRYLLSTDAEDIVDECQLWDDVQRVVDTWEEAKGACWAYEFEDKMRGKETKSCCVSSRLRVEGRPTGRTSWRRGGEGLYACGKCVEEGKPCFTWDGEGFRLLPLHEGDRDARWPVGEGFEVRYWVNGE